MPIHLIVTGSRTLTDDTAWTAIFNQLDYIHKQHIVLSITTGAGKGCDQAAKSWAQLHNLPTHDFPADWSLGRKAGPIRNRQMIRETLRKFKRNSIVCVAFTDKELEKSKGTSNTVKVAGEQGLDTHHYTVMGNTTYKQF